MDDRAGLNLGRRDRLDVLERADCSADIKDLPGLVVRVTLLPWVVQVRVSLSIATHQPAKLWAHFGNLASNR